MIFETDVKGGQLSSTWLNLSNEKSTEYGLYLLNNINSRDLEQHSLFRLKAQREKIEELVNSNDSLQKELNNIKLEKKNFQQIVEQMREDAQYKQFYVDLKEQFQKLLTAHELAQFEIEELKIQLERAVTSAVEESQQLKGEIRKEKETLTMNIEHLQGIISDKEEQLQKVKRENKSILSRFKMELQQLKIQNQQLKEQLQMKGSELQQRQCLMKRQINTKQTDSFVFQKTIQQLKKQVNMLKLDVSTINFQKQRERQEYLQIIQQGRSTLRLLKKEKDDKQEKNSELLQINKRYQLKNKSLQESLQNLKKSMSKAKDKSKSALTRQTQSTYQEIAKLEASITRLKKQIEKHVQEYNLLSIEHKRCKTLMQQRETYERQRKKRLMSQMREINKIDKEINRFK